MENEIEIKDLIKRGGIIKDLKGDSVFEIYKKITEVQSFPEYITADKIYSELVQREELMSTAVGNGIAIPHPRYSLLKRVEDERIIVCYPEKTIQMNGPDVRPVYVFFVILTSSSKTHLQVLSRLSFLFQRTEFKEILEKKPSEDELLKVVDDLLTEKNITD